MRLRDSVRTGIWTRTPFQYVYDVCMAFERNSSFLEQNTVFEQHLERVRVAQERSAAANAEHVR